MEVVDLLELVKEGESSEAQFEEAVDIEQLSQEFSAMANSNGGMILIGVGADGVLKGFSAERIRELHQWVSIAACQQVSPPVALLTEIVAVDERNVLVVKVAPGYAKPYYTRKGVAYVKTGRDKRIASPEEVLRLFQHAGKIYADQSPVLRSSLNDIDERLLKILLVNKFRTKFEGTNIRALVKRPLDELLAAIDADISLAKLLENMKLSEGDNLTLAGLLLLGENPQKFKPLFSVKCVSFVGNDASGGQFRDKEDLFEGNLYVQYSKAMNFLIRNLRQTQIDKGYNSLGQLEIPREVLEDIVVNALIHRDYYISSSIQIFVFDNRVEIASPGILANALNESNVRFYTSIARNPIIYSNCACAGLPFTGIGSGIPKALNLLPNIILNNDKICERLVVIIPRPV
jgi:predicted HTH transcriptional regulator